MKMMMYRQYIITGMNKMNAAELFAEKQTYLDHFHASGYPAAFEDYQSQVRAFFEDLHLNKQKKKLKTYANAQQRA